MKKLGIFLSALLIIVVSWSCQKSGGTIQIAGTVLDWHDNKPIPCTIRVNAGKTQPSDYLLDLATFHNESDGSFHREVSAATSHKYYIRLSGPSVDLYEKDIFIPDGGIRDLGRIYAAHTFVCKVRLLRDPGSMKSVKFSSGWIVPFDRSPDTTYYDSKSVSYSPNGPAYPLTYTVFAANSESKLVSIPITMGDTVTAEIRY